MGRLFSFRTVPMSLLAPQVLLLFALTGSLAGLLAGLLGIGGGIILVPLFLWAFEAVNLPSVIVVHAAFATSLCVIIPSAISSTLGHRRRGNVQWRQVMRMAVGGICGALLGAAFAASLSGDWLKGLFGGMQILAAGKMFFSDPRLPPEESDFRPWGRLLLIGLIGGLFSAFFGAGGGFIVVPLMLMWLRMPMHLAVGNSSALIVISAIFGVLSYIYHGWNHPLLPPHSFGYVNLLAAGLVIPFTMIFARLGVRLAGRFSHAKLVRIFALMLLVIGTRMIIATLGF